MVSCIDSSCDVSFSQFEYVSHLSSGAQGTTSLRKGIDGKLYCFKTVPIHFSTIHPEEIVLQNQIKSPFIVELLHSFHVEGQIKLCMDYCHGGSLHDLLESGVVLSGNSK
ncbi:hypothetical protein RCL1_007119 [Eukaryota sp. TZLM3-RCL]